MTAEINLVSEGVKFMILGMGTVFVFLILMIFTLQIQAKVIQKFFPQTNIPHKRDESASKKDVNEDKRVVAAITGAVTAFKKS